LADADRVDCLHVRWLSGIEQVFDDLPARQLLVIPEGAQTVRKSAP
jgi:hypothetical protein